MESNNTVASPSAVLALVLLAADEGRIQKSQEGMASMLYQMKSKGLAIGPISVQVLGGHFYSPQLERFVGSLLSTGRATQRSPISLSRRGEELCREIVSRELRANPAAMNALLKYVGVEIAEPN